MEFTHCKGGVRVMGRNRRVSGADLLKGGAINVQPCKICGYDKGIQVHHIDGNLSNNVSSNLMILCEFHHMLEGKSGDPEWLPNLFRVNVFKI